MSSNSTGSSSSRPKRRAAEHAEKVLNNDPDGVAVDVDESDAEDGCEAAHRAKVQRRQREKRDSDDAGDGAADGAADVSSDDNDVEDDDDDDDEEECSAGAAKKKSKEEVEAEKIIQAFMGNRASFACLRSEASWVARVVGDRTDKSVVLSALIAALSKPDLSREQMDNAVTLAQVACMNVQLPTAAAARVLGPLAALRGATFAKISTHLSELYGAAVFAQICDFYTAASDPAAFRARGQELELDDTDVAAAMSGEAISSMRRVLDSTVERINRLDEDARLRCLLRHVCQLGSPAGTGRAPIRTASKHPEVDRSLFDSHTIPKNLAYTAVEWGATGVVVELIGLAGGHLDRYLQDAGFVAFKSSSFPTRYDQMLSPKQMAFKPFQAHSISDAHSLAVVKTALRLLHNGATHIGKAVNALTQKGLVLRTYVLHQRPGCAARMHPSGRTGPRSRDLYAWTNVDGEAERDLGDALAPPFAVPGHKKKSSNKQPLRVGLIKFVCTFDELPMGRRPIYTSGANGVVYDGKVVTSTQARLMHWQAAFRAEFSAQMTECILASGPSLRKVPLNPKLLQTIEADARARAEESMQQSLTTWTGNFKVCRHNDEAKARCAEWLASLKLSSFPYDHRSWVD